MPREEPQKPSLKDRKEAAKIFLTSYHISVMVADALLRVFQLRFMRLGEKSSFCWLFSFLFMALGECVKERERRIEKLERKVKEEKQM